MLLLYWAREDSPLTYRRLSTQIKALGERLNQLGIGRGDRVAVVLPNGPEMAVAFLGVAASATCAPLNPAYRADEFDFYLSDLNAKALLVSGGLDSPAVVSAQKRAIPVLKLSLDSDGRRRRSLRSRDRGNRRQ